MVGTGENVSNDADVPGVVNRRWNCVEIVPLCLGLDGCICYISSYDQRDYI